ncbi:MAG TPA: hypothetical protein VGU67_02970 [Edaphobacter sp.]|nr:hypothetical protein [Edaphobacter sp.]
MLSRPLIARAAAIFTAILTLTSFGLSQALPYTPVAAAAYVNAGSGWNPWTNYADFGALSFIPPAIGLYCQSSQGAPWTPCQPGSGEGAVSSVNTQIGAVNLTAFNVGAPVNSEYISVRQVYGAVGDGAHAAADTTGLTNGIAAVCASGQTLFIPAGTYNFTNSSGAFAFPTGCKGHIQGVGAASHIVFSTLANDGFQAPSTVAGFEVDHLAMSFAGSITTRASTGYELNVAGGTRPYIHDIAFSNGNISGLRLYQTTGAKLQSLNFVGQLANGIYAPDNYQFTVDSISGNMNGDGLVEFDCGINSFAGNCGNGTISNVLSTDDVTGILLNGVPNVSVNNCTIMRPAHQGILVEEDGGSDDSTVYPDNVVITNCNVYGAGTSTNPLNNTAAFGFVVSIAGTPGTKQRITYANSKVIGAGGNAIQVADSNTVDLKVVGVHVESSGASGATGTNGRNQACINVDGDHIELDSVVAVGCGGPSLYSASTNYITGTGLTSINPNSTALTTNAIYYASANTFNTLNLPGVTLIDTQTTNASGITNAATAGTQNIQSIGSAFSHTWPGITNSNPSASIYAASTHDPNSGGTPSAGTVNTTYAGTGGTATPTITGHDNAFQVSFTTGTGTTAGSGSGGSVVFQVTFANSFSTAPLCNIQPANLASVGTATLPASSTGQFNFSVGGTALPASTALKFNVFCR